MSDYETVLEIERLKRRIERLEAMDANYRVSNNAPTATAASGYSGELRVSANYLYVAFGNNLWRRISATGW
jgi:hypothetical protein